MKLLSTLVFFSATIALSNCIPGIVVAVAKDAVALMFKEILKTESDGVAEIARSFITTMSPVLKILKIDIDEGYGPQLTRIEENIERGFNTTYTKIDFLQTFMKKSFDALATDVKFSDMRLLQVDIETGYNHFHSIVDGYSSDKAELLKHLNTFIAEYRSKNNEQRLVNLLKEEAYGSSSLMDALIKSAKADSDTMLNKKKTSPNRLVYDFYQSVLFMIYKGNIFLSSCYQIKDQLAKSE